MRDDDGACECVACCCPHRPECSNAYHRASHDARIGRGESYLPLLCRSIGRTACDWTLPLMAADVILLDRGYRWDYGQPFGLSAIEFQGLLTRHPNMARPFREALERWRRSGQPMWLSDRAGSFPQ